MIITPTFGWKKVLGRCCLTMSSGIVRLTTKTHTNSIGCLGTNYVILKFGMHVDLGNNLIRVSTAIFPIENRFNFVANITSSFFI